MNCTSNEHNKIQNKLTNSSEFLHDVEMIANIFSLLGDSNRVKILLALMKGELCVYHICEIVGGKQSAISQHLRKLKDNHLVKSRKDGNQVLYSIDDVHVVQIINTALKHKKCIHN